MNGNFECVFEGGKKRRKSSSTAKKSTKKSSRSKKAETTSYCYKCNSSTADSNVITNGTTRDSNCSKCSSKRSVFIK